MSDGGLVRGPSVFSLCAASTRLTVHKREDTHGLNRQEKDHDGKAQP
jgi:hypothetical protein